MKPTPTNGICNTRIKVIISRSFQFQLRSVLVHLPIMSRWMVIEVKVFLSMILLSSSSKHFTRSSLFTCCNSLSTCWDSCWASVSLWETVCRDCWYCWSFVLSNAFLFYTLSSSCQIFAKSVVESIELVVKLTDLSCFRFLFALLMLNSTLFNKSTLLCKSMMSVLIDSIAALHPGKQFFMAWRMFVSSALIHLACCYLMTIESLSAY